MKEKVYLDATSLLNRQLDEAVKYDIQRHKIGFEFSEGFCDIRIIEECRALNALDVSIPDNFDLMYDIMMQMLTGKPVSVIFHDDNGESYTIADFQVTGRYMNLRGVPLINAYPVIVNWMVEFIAGYLGKKYPRSLKSIRGIVGVSVEPLKKNPKKRNRQTLFTRLTEKKQ